MNTKLIDVALGHMPADLVIKNGRLVNVLTREVYPADISISGDSIAAIGTLADGAIGPQTTVIDAEGKYLAPGFIDAHIHFESSMLTFTEFNRLVLARGTTGVASDVMEVSIVSGFEAIKEVFNEAVGLPVKLHNPVVGFVEEDEEMQTVGAYIQDSAAAALIAMPHAVGFAEIVPQSVLEKGQKMQRIWALAQKHGKTLEGHAPCLRGPELSAYASAGIRSDHECVAADEALDKLRHGIRLLIREGSAAKDLKACIQTITRNHVDPRYCSIVSDDIDMHYILTNGHLDHKVRMAVKEGVDPLVALQMVTINPAESLKIDARYGSITPGKCADIVFLRDLADCTVTDVVANGTIALRDGQVVYPFPDYQYPDFMRGTVKLKKPVTADDLLLKAKSGTDIARVRVMGVSGTSLISEALQAELPVVDGAVRCNPDQDVLHMACVERYGKNGNIGLAFVQGFGLKKGAMATSMGHDHHNIIAVGTNPEDMATAIKRIAELDGGAMVVEDEKVLYELPLPICGLLSTMDGAEAAGVLGRMQDHLHMRGCQMESPFMSLAFTTLAIPAYAITDKGLIDASTYRPVDPIL